MARILALTSRMPWPPREGHQLRSYHVLDALASSHEVHLLSCARGDDIVDAPSSLREKLSGFETFAVPADHSRARLAMALARSLLSRRPYVVSKYDVPALRARIDALAAEHDLIHVDMLPLMQHVLNMRHTVPVVLNAHNVEHELLRARAEVEPRASARLFLKGQIYKLHAFERSACARADAVLACSDDDAQKLRALAPRTPVHVVPNGVDLDYNKPAARLPGKPVQMVFVGQMGWFPNRDGVEWFLADILPRIVEARPDAHFVLVGKAQGLSVPPWLKNNVRLAGFVDDVRTTVHDSAIYVVPLRAGSGTRLKVLEAMALGKAIVTTTIGAEGIRLQPGSDALFADDADTFARSVLALLDDPANIARLGTAARQAAERHYGWAAIGNSMLSAYTAALDRDKSRRRDGGNATRPAT